ncbi:Superoxide dismutase [Cu-Zn], partial [Trachymyrmex septentrionalis]
AASALRLAAYVSSGGLHGEFRFERATESSVRIRYSLKPTLQYPDQQWLWSVTYFSVDYTIIDGRCDERHIGQSMIDLTEKVGPLELPTNQTGSIEVSDLSLTGEMGLWGKSLVLKDNYSPRTICASITVLERDIEKFAQARFHGPIAGTVLFRWLDSQVGNDLDTIIHTNLHHIHKQKLQSLNYTEHHWKIYVTDILETGKDKNNCNILQNVFDPNNSDIGKSIGDVDVRLGKIKVAIDSQERCKTFYRDSELSLLPTNLLGPHRHLYLVIFHPVHEDSFLACTKINHRKPTYTKAIINSRGIRGQITAIQETPFNPTWINISLSTINNLEIRLRYATKIASYRIHELPPEPAKNVGIPIDSCSTTKKLFNPSNIDEQTTPPPGYGTQDQYAIGDLSGKLQDRKEGSYHNDILPGSAKLSGIYWDTYLPLSGIHSIIHRSLVLYRFIGFFLPFGMITILTSQWKIALKLAPPTLYNETDNSSMVPWVCGTFVLYTPHTNWQMPLYTAEVIFRYPIVGRILFRQSRDDPEMDTTIIIEYLVHADGNAINNTANHRWMIHENLSGKDFYNWKNRCLSAGSPYNPYKVDWKLNSCFVAEASLCRLGDLTRHGTLEIAGRKANALKLTRRLFTDTMLSLSGSHSLFGKSLVIYDDHGPVARGDRLACTIIGGVYRRKAVVRNWFGNGEQISLKGKLELWQQTEYDITNVEVSLEGLDGEMSGYHIHTASIEYGLEFPCEETSLYESWNPLDINSDIPATEEGTLDQYKMGDLSGKFGTLDNKKRYTITYNDTMLPLFGPKSILGRSIVIHKKEKNLRWACSTIERGYSPVDAYELSAIASFHHPQGFVYGYIRMTQLVYKDGSQSETIIEVNLRHPGKHNHNITRNHNWAIYVNPVGVDAAVKIKDTRCVAAGYIWNPYFTQLADPLNDDLYREECGPDLLLRCYVGDISSRLGPINIGEKRQIFTDFNFPLDGPVSAMGKSIIIFDKDFSGNRFACTNIEPDNNIVKYANIRKPPRFVVAQFLEDVRKVMGIPEWMLSIDSRKTRILHNGACIQFLLHFKGPIANKLEQDFSKLLSFGKLEAPSLYIPGYTPIKGKTTLRHRQCGVRDSDDENFNVHRSTSISLLADMFVTFVVIVNSVT